MYLGVREPRSSIRSVGFEDIVIVQLVALKPGLLNAASSILHAFSSPEVDKRFFFPAFTAVLSCAKTHNAYYV